MITLTKMMTFTYYFIIIHIVCIIIIIIVNEYLFLLFLIIILIIIFIFLTFFIFVNVIIIIRGYSPILIMKQILKERNGMTRTETGIIQGGHKSLKNWSHWEREKKVISCLYFFLSYCWNSIFLNFEEKIKVHRLAFFPSFIPTFFSPFFVSLFVCLLICLFVFLVVCSFFCLFIYLFTCLFVCSFVCVFPFPSPPFFSFLLICFFQLVTLPMEKEYLNFFIFSFIIFISRTWKWKFEKKYTPTKKLSTHKSFIIFINFCHYLGQYISTSEWKTVAIT